MPKEKRIKPPSDFDSEQDFLLDMRKKFLADMDADRTNRDAGIEDAEFLVGNQWPDSVKQQREADKKPVLTINRLPAFVAQVIGNRRLNQTLINVVPDHGGTKDVAEVRQGLIRNIQKVSRAEVAYTKAYENQVSCGIGNFQSVLEYASDDVFEQDIHIQAIPNPFAVVWDRMSIDPTGRDARHCFVVDHVGKEEFEELYPGKSPGDMGVNTELYSRVVSEGWVRQDDVRVVSYWRVRARARELALMRDGSTKDITDVPEEELYNLETGESAIVRRQDGTEVRRETQVKYAEMYVASGMNLLEGPYELPIDRVPVYRVPGWEIRVGEVRHRWGIVRFLKDPQRLHNYWRSIVAEKLMLTPKAKFIASAEAVAGREKEWRNAHKATDPLLIYNGEAGQPPAFAPPAQLEPALINEAGMAVQDIKDISNLHEASLGVQSNEVSGKAILARQRVGELGTVLYQDNLNDAIEECGRVINQLIPFVYDTPRIVKIIGEDEKDLMQVVNDTGNSASVDLSVGKYAVSITTGPSYVTKRVEAAESMLNLINAMPQVMAIAADKVVEAQDWPGAEEISRRLRNALPPGTIDPEDMDPKMQQQMQMRAQEQQKIAQLAEQGALLDLKEREAKVRESLGRAALAEAQAKKAESEIGTKAQEVQVDAAAAGVKAKSIRLQDSLATIKLAEGENRGDEQRAAARGG